MMPGKLFFHLKLLFCMVVVATEGKKKKVKKNVNMCEIEEAQVIFCYCDILEIDKAEEGNCWIFNDTSEHEDIWDSFASQTKIKRLTLHLRPDGSLKAIPSEAIGYLSSLEFFEVQYATFGTVSAFSFGNSTTLSKISLARNSIKTLARNAFAHLTSLTFLSLGENHITEVNRHVFVNLPNLTELYMDRNNITILHDRAFQNLHGLTNLALFSNQIQVITPDTFRGLLSLDTLDLSKNRLEVIGNNTFEELRSLRTLDLQENSLKYIAPNGFQGLNNLLKLNLQDNKLLKIGSEVFKRAPKVVHLDIRANVLSTLAYETVEPIFSNLKNHTMMFFLEDNNFRCDTRLSWMFVLHNTTSSSSVRRNLESLFCYLEVGTLPPRLDGQTVTPAYDTTTLGIGKKLFDLHEQIECIIVMDSLIDPEKEHLRHGASTNKESGRNKAQNDMAPT
ncbi:connectin-like isoform X2 [Macrobrachium rosenbergii]